MQDGPREEVWGPLPIDRSTALENRELDMDVEVFVAWEPRVGTPAPRARETYPVLIGWRVGTGNAVRIMHLHRQDTGGPYGMCGVFFGAHTQGENEDILGTCPPVRVQTMRRCILAKLGRDQRATLERVPTKVKERREEKAIGGYVAWIEEVLRVARKKQLFAKEDVDRVIAQVKKDLGLM
jgi:hypothetical protein